YREAIRLKKDYPLAHNNLKRALALAAELDTRIAAALQGEEEVVEPQQRLAYARHCERYKRPHASARFYWEAFALDPALADNLNTQDRYNAACAAALAGCAQGKDTKALSHTERARLRRQALGWLRADLDAWRKVLKQDPDKGRAAVAKTMQHWLNDAD